MQIQELDAEIKHAFADLESNERTCQDLQAKADDLASQLDDALKHIREVEARLHAKSAELQGAQIHHSEQTVRQTNPFLTHLPQCRNLTCRRK